MSQEGRGSQQVKRSAGLNFLCARMLPRPDMETIPFVGQVSGITPALCKETPRGFGTGVPVQNGTKLDLWGLYKPNQNRALTSVATSHGALALSASDPDYAYLPSADAVDFLSHTQGTRRISEPARFFPI